MNRSSLIATIEELRFCFYRRYIKKSKGEILMTNDTWKYNFLQVSDLPIKAQRFIEMTEIDTRLLKLMTLTPSPDGKFYKDFGEDESGIGKRMAMAEFTSIYFFSERVQVGVAIHELAHVYFTQLRFNGYEYNLRAIGEKFIEQYGIYALSYYARANFYENDWEEVVCEIIAVYGRRGQFDKIKELLNQENINSENGGM
jgi:hypothetical protein